MVKVAVSGCVHGHLDAMYETLEKAEAYHRVKADVLLCTGDFQAIRDDYDLASMMCPVKYRQIGDFQDYYLKRKVAKISTIVIGGNHESSLYFSAAANGGYIAPNIYYLGRTGVVNFGSLVIAGISGIYHEQSYFKPLSQFPRTEKDFKNYYRVRKTDVDRIAQISSPDIFMSHDWPQGVYNFGNTEQLLKIKPFLRTQIMNGSLGSPANKQLLDHLCP